MRTKILSELRQAYEPLKELWNDWIRCKSCGLSEVEINVMAFHVRNSFVVALNDFPMFYSKIDIVFSLIQKLNSSYLEFKEWVVTKFQYSILNIAKDPNFYVAGMSREVMFFKLPVVILPVSNSIRSALLKFNKQTLEQLFDSYSGQDFLEKSLFEIIIKFQVAFNESAVRNKKKLLPVCQV